MSKNISNKVIGLTRNKPTLEAKLEKAGITTLAVLEGDVGDLTSLKVR